MGKARGGHSGRAKPAAGTPEASAIPWREAWNSAMSLFSYGKAGETCGSLRHEDLRSAFAIFLAGALITAMITLAVSAEAAYFKEYTYRTLAEAGIGTEPQISMDWFAPLAAFLLLFGVPFGMLLAFLYEGAAYQLMRMSGGRGTFGRQCNVSSVVMLSMALSSAVLFAAPVPCMGLLAIAAYAALILYFTFFVRCKAYESVHGISFQHAFVIVLVVTAITAAIAFAANDAVAAIFSISAGV